MLGLYYDKVEPVLICQQCRYALKPSSETVTRHLGEKHRISASARRGLNRFVASLRLPDPNKLPLRQDGTTPHPHLLIKSGVVCSACYFCSTSIDIV